MTERQVPSQIVQLPHPPLSKLRSQVLGQQLHRLDTSLDRLVAKPLESQEGASREKKHLSKGNPLLERWELLFRESVDRRDIRQKDQEQLKQSTLDLKAALSSLDKTFAPQPTPKINLDMDETELDALLDPDAAPKIKNDLPKRVGLGPYAVIDVAANEKITTLTNLLGNVVKENEQLRSQNLALTKVSDVHGAKYIDFETTISNQQLKIQSLEQLVHKLRTRRDESSQSQNKLTRKKSQFQQQGGSSEKGSPTSSLLLSRSRSIVDSGHVVEVETFGEDSGPKGHVAVVFLHVEGAATLWDLAPVTMKRSLRFYCDTLRLAIAEHDGYEAKSREDSFMLIFPTSFAAVEFSMDIQKKLMEVSWPVEWETIPHAATVRKVRAGDASGATHSSEYLFRGLRVAVAVHSGEPSTQIDPLTGRTDYLGDTVSYCLEISKVTPGGVVSLSDDVIRDPDVSEYLQKKPSVVQIMKMGKVCLSDDAKVVLHRICPINYKERLEPTSSVEEQRTSPKRQNDLEVQLPQGSIVCAVALRVEATELMKAQFGDEFTQENIELVRNEVVKLNQFCKGYFISDDGLDRMLVMFSSSETAFQFSLRLQQALLGVEWPKKLLDWEPTCEECSSNGITIFRGLRLQIGLHEGEVDWLTSQRDPITALPKCEGEFITTAAGLSQVARGGQTIISSEVNKKVSHCLHQFDNSVIKPFGRRILLPGMDHHVTAFSAFSNGLKDRDTSLDPSGTSIWVSPLQHLLKHSPLGNCAFVALDIDHAQELWGCDEKAMQETVSIVKNKIHFIGLTFGAFQFDTDGEATLLVFQRCIDATMFCLQLQEGLLQCTFPESIVACPFASMQQNSRCATIWNGPRMRMGLHYGLSETIIDPTSQRVAYFGRVVGRASHLAENAKGGQIILSKSIYVQIQDHLDSLGNPVIQQNTAFSDSDEAAQWIMIPRNLIDRVFDVESPEEEETEEYEIAHPSNAANNGNGEESTHSFNLSKLTEKHFHAPRDYSWPHSLLPVFQAPQGMIVLVLADVEGALSLWESCPSIMPQCVKTLFSVVRENLAVTNGYEVRNDQDAFFLTFRQVSDALQWSNNVQSALLKVKWPKQLIDQESAREVFVSKGALRLSAFRGLRFRISIDVGEPICEMDRSTGKMEYLGPAVYRASKVGAWGHGGQIILTRDAHDWFLSEQVDLAKLDKPTFSELGKRRIQKRSVDLSPSVEEGGDLEVVELVQALPVSFLHRQFPPLREDDDARAERFLELEAILLQKEENRVKAPSGDVTFAFTEVEQFDSLSETCSSMAENIEIYTEVVRRSISIFGGYEVKTSEENECFMIAFHCAADAVNFACYTQIALRDAKWPEEFLTLENAHVATVTEDGFEIWRGLRVKMSVHASADFASQFSASADRMDYSGEDVNTAARMLTVASGGEIVVSERTLKSVLSHEDIVLSFVSPIGNHVLVDGGTPHSLFRVAPAQLLSRSFSARPSRNLLPDSNATEQDWWLVKREVEVVEEEEEVDNMEEILQVLAPLVAGSTDPQVSKLPDVLQQGWKGMKKKYRTGRVKCNELEKKLQHSETEIMKLEAQLRAATEELKKVHQSLRFYSSQVKAFLASQEIDETPSSPSGDPGRRGTTVIIKNYTDDDFIKNWVQHQRQLDHHGGKAPPTKQRANPKDDFAIQLRLVIEDEKEEERFKNNPARIARSVGGHLAKSFVTLNKFVKRIQKSWSDKAKMGHVIAAAETAQKSASFRRTSSAAGLWGKAQQVRTKSFLKKEKEERLENFRFEPEPSSDNLPLEDEA